MAEWGAEDPSWTGGQDRGVLPMALARECAILAGCSEPPDAITGGTAMRRSLLTLLTFAMLLTVNATGVAAAPPDNDQIVDARTVDGLPYTDEVDTSEATSSDTDPDCSGGDGQTVCTGSGPPRTARSGWRWRLTSMPRWTSSPGRRTISSPSPARTIRRVSTSMLGLAGPITSWSRHAVDGLAAW